MRALRKLEEDKEREKRKAAMEEKQREEQKKEIKRRVSYRITAPTLYTYTSHILLLIPTMSVVEMGSLL